MALFSTWKTKKTFYAVGAAAIAAVLSVFIVMGVTTRKGKTEENEAAARRVPVEDFDSADLVLPKEFTEVWRQDWVPFRERKKMWTEEDIEPYWSDTKEVLLEVLEKQTVDTLMMNLSPDSSGMEKTEEKEK